ncbi:ATP phosphoribosyltransferase [Stomatohabitans albus]|uniref:ATP phosphoribosyltransferase n=1 Tax=Stomatohabitans albus TaxID=3110766 RepID=UPI00300D0368
MTSFPTAVQANSHDLVRLGVPSKGRLRDFAIELLSTAGYHTTALRGTGSAVQEDSGLEFIEMRPRDAAAALAVGTLDGAFLSTDIAAEFGLGAAPRLPLGYARNRLIVASRDDDGRTSVQDLAGGTVATHQPVNTQRFFDQLGINVTVVHMGGSLEGVCAAGIADAIVDNSETGTSLRQNRLRVLAEIMACEAEFVHSDEAHPIIDDLVLRVKAALDARQARYVMLHIPVDRIDDLRGLFPGLASPTVLPLAGRDDLVALHFVCGNRDLWANLSDLRALGATGIVALQVGALLN